jgi:glucose-1-phosphate cytidylyltransferase
VLLAGGLGTRIREETSEKPKPMIEVGGKPLLWHLMKSFSQFGIKRFIVCTGYKSEVIADYFANYKTRNFDFTINTTSQNEILIHSSKFESDWEVTVAYTGGVDVGTGGRISRVQKYIDTYPFICTYGDGLSDINIRSLVEFHKSKMKTATVTVTNPTNRFGVVEIFGDAVKSFKEKPKTDGWVNSGYFVFEREIWKQLDENCTLELQPLQMLAQNQQLMAYKHIGNWQAMDTFRDYQFLQDAWSTGNAFWKTWE